MPRGGTRKSLKWPALYDKLRAKFSKRSAARISNARAAQKARGQWWSHGAMRRLRGGGKKG